MITPVHGNSVLLCKNGEAGDFNADGIFKKSFSKILFDDLTEFKFLDTVYIWMFEVSIYIVQTNSRISFKIWLDWIESPREKINIGLNQTNTL